MRRETYVALPREDPRWREGFCAFLLTSLYGLKDASLAFGFLCDGTVEDSGFEVGAWCPSVYKQVERDLPMWRHGDDFIVRGHRQNIDWVMGTLEKTMVVKARAVLGFGPKDDREIDILNRILTVQFDENGQSKGSTLEADPRLGQVSSQQVGVDAKSEERGKSRAAANPMNKAQDGGGFFGGPALEAAEVKKYRSAVLRLNFLSSDRPELSFC